jgi:hypothetical protein
MSSVFRRTVEELLSVNLAQAALFLFGPGLTVVPQKALEPEGYCRSRMYEHYEAVVSFSYFLVFTTFASSVMGGYVKTRVPDAADGGLQSLAPKRRKVLLVFAAVAGFLNLAASVLALVTYSFVLQAKLGLFECLPAATRFGVYVTYLVVGSVLAVTYIDSGRIILMAAH